MMRLDKWHVPNPTQQGRGRNAKDAHANTFCAGWNWCLLDFSGKVCEVQPFQQLMKPVKEMPVASCATVWTSPKMERDYLLVAVQFLCLGALCLILC